MARLLHSIDISSTITSVSLDCFGLGLEAGFMLNLWGRWVVDIGIGFANFWIKDSTDVVSFKAGLLMPTLGVGL